MAAIVLDKCFLQAASWQAICGLAKRHDLLITGSLFHELLTGNQEARRKVFAKLPRQDNPVLLLDNVSSLLAHEGNTHTPAGDVSSHTLKLAFRFNPRLKENGYELPPGVLEAVAENEARTRRLVESYVARTNAVVDMFHPVTTGSDKGRLVALAEIEKEISDPKSVLTFYRSLGDPKLPPADLLTPDWATFRFYQTSLLFSLHTVHRHRGPVPVPQSARGFQRLEHDVHDHMVLCTGILAGGLATNERKLKDWCALLNPGALVVSS
ncbi:hypothetical protein [Cognatilysobacter tabacisoli]|uniref:hypothetical protein n=1 Tax=Cognatilysobacter tabacisoli TaxID=2315424 RepID=UPI0013005C9A|nr:hypothetical protein [Lysobacter tabacisoli]